LLAIGLGPQRWTFFFLYVTSLQLGQNNYLFPVSTAKLNGNFWTNRQSAAKLFPHCAYSFQSLMLCQYFWHCDFYSTCRQSATNKIKKSANFLLLARQMHPASPIGVASVPHFA
jgi:uncharacterized protein YjfI (DUF2170 family)